MSLQVLTGVVSHTNQGSSFGHTVSPIGDQVLTHKLQLFSFRIDGKPVIYRTAAFLSISDGDRVAVAGTMKNGMLEVAAFRNLSTGASYAPPTGGLTYVGWFMIVIGIPAIILMGLGFALIGFGIWMLSRVGNVKKAYKLVNAAV